MTIASGHLPIDPSAVEAAGDRFITWVEGMEEVEERVLHRLLSFCHEKGAIGLFLREDEHIFLVVGDEPKAFPRLEAIGFLLQVYGGEGNRGGIPKVDEPFALTRSSYLTRYLFRHVPAPDHGKCRIRIGRAKA